MEMRSHCRAKIRWRTRISIWFSSVVLMSAAFLLPAANFYAGTSPANVPWPGGIVPYEFTNTLTAAQTNTYLDGLREWELAANVSFVPHTNQTHWILFTYNNHANVGRLRCHSESIPNRGLQQLGGSRDAAKRLSHSGHRRSRLQRPSREGHAPD